MNPRTSELREAIVSHAMRLGWFERFTRYEPKSPPGPGISVAFWGQASAPVPLGSGLAETCLRREFQSRLYKPMLTEPQDEIDPQVMDAADDMMQALTGDFTLGGLVRNIDLLGAHGVGLSWQAGYQTINQTAYRIVTIVIPMVVDSAWAQEA